MSKMTQMTKWQSRSRHSLSLCCKLPFLLTPGLFAMESWAHSSRYKITYQLQLLSSCGTLRSLNTGFLPIPRTRRRTFGDRTFDGAVPTFWNSLPVEIRLALTLYSALKECLFTQAYASKSVCLFVFFYLLHVECPWLSWKALNELKFLFYYYKAKRVLFYSLLMNVAALQLRWGSITLCQVSPAAPINSLRP